jgi:hypothetical protein
MPYKYKPKDYSNEPILFRQDAIAQDKKYYFTGVPCLRGHIAPRFTTGGTCLECNYLAAKAKYEGTKLPKVKGTDMGDEYELLDKPINGIALQSSMLRDEDRRDYELRFREADSYDAFAMWVAAL